MLESLKNNVRLLRRSKRHVILFELTYKLLAVAVIYPILTAAINLCMKVAGIRYLTNEYIVKALGLGVKGYILKQDFEAIIPALKAVYGGQSVFGGEVVSKIPALTAAKHDFSYADYDIGEKEQEIIEQAAMGKSNREIAQSLFLSEGTVRNYISAILEKLSLRDRTQLVVFYFTKIC